AVIPKSSLQGNYANYAYSAESQFSDVKSIIQAATNELQNEYEDIKALIADHIAEVDDRVKLTLIPGMSPVDDIVEYAEKIRCDLIIMGSRGLGAIRGIMGSVSTGVLRYASMPVLIVK
nr:universal stress protein [bacterium]